MDIFAVLAEPTRRDILGQLALGESSVNELAFTLELSQPAVSKHLKVLRETGFVSRRGSAQQRIYSLESAPFQSFAAWLEPYRRLWTRHLDALERHLDAQEKRHDSKSLSTRPARGGRRPTRR